MYGFETHIYNIKEAYNAKVYPNELDMSQIHKTMKNIYN